MSRAVVLTLAILGLGAGCAPHAKVLEGCLYHPAALGRVTYRRTGGDGTGVDVRIHRLVPESPRHEHATYTLWVAPALGGDYEPWGSITLGPSGDATVHFSTIHPTFRLLVTEEDDARPIFPSRRVVVEGLVDTAPLPRALPPARMRLYSSLRDAFTAP
jgi:hypothetical protein